MPRTLAALFVLLLSVPLAAQTDSRQLQEFRAEAEAFNRQDPFSNSYRAGHYNGYLSGFVAALQGREICFKECPCEIDKRVAAHLAQHPEALARPVAEWLLPLLRAAYPCP